MSPQDVKINKSVFSLFISEIVDDVLFKFKRNVLKQELNIPWMRYREINLIKDLLTRLQPESSLEWGAGTGTKYFTQFVPENGRWMSIEHDEKWAALVDEQISNPNISIVYKGPNHEPEPGVYTCGTYTEENDGTYEDFKNYIEYPAKHAPYDFILVDGRARSACVIKAREYLSERGIVLLHDANRTYYHDAFDYYKQGVTFLDERTVSGGIWIGTDSERPLSEIIDVETYSKLWDFYKQFGKVIRV